MATTNTPKEVTTCQFRRPKSRCLMHLAICIGIGGTAWMLRQNIRDPMTLLPLLMALLVAAYLVLEIWTNCRGSVLVLRPDGIASRKHGFIPWTDVAGLKLALPPAGIGVDSAALHVSVRNPERYREKLTYPSIPVGRKTDESAKVGRVISISLDGLNRRPQDILEAAEWFRVETHRTPHG